MKNCEIKLYALSTCTHCKDTKSFLDKCGIDYDCVEVDKLEGDQRREIIDEIKKSNPSCAFPMLIIGDKVIIGFRKDEIKEALDLE
jgi:glutaredoxin-like protein NrdH